MTWSSSETALLEARAARLVRAREPEPVVALPEAIVVSSSGVEVAVVGKIVRAVRRLTMLTVVHSGPPTLLGVFAHGERILPAYRLSALLGRPPLPAERPHVVVVGEVEPELGLEVDRVVGVDVVRPSTLSWPFELPVCGETSAGTAVLEPQSLLHISSDQSS